MSSHENTKKILKIVGPVVAAAGLVLTVIGFSSLFSSADSFEAPRFFWLSFLGLPLTAIGLMITMFAFHHNISRFVAEEQRPIVSDMVATVTDASLRVVEGRVCSCGEKCDHDARFCSRCGLPLFIKCDECGEENDNGAKFCHSCGKELKRPGTQA